MKPSVVELIEEAVEAFENWYIQLHNGGNLTDRKLARDRLIDAAVALAEETEEQQMQGHGGRDA